MKNFIILFIAGVTTLIPTKIWAQDILKLSLIQCREMAIAYSEDLKKSKNTLEQADIDRKIATTAMLPSLDGSAMGMYMFPDMDMMGSELQMRGSYMAGITLTQPIYAGGKIIAGRKLAKIGQEAAKEELRKTRIQVIADADNAYWTYVAVLRKVRMLKAYYAQIETLYQQTELSVHEGMAIENELLRIAAKRSDIEYQLQKVKNGAYLCRLSICRLTGTDYSVEVEPTDTNIVVIAPRQLDSNIAERPELRLLEKQMEAKSQEIKSVRADYLPTVGLSIGYSYMGNLKMKGISTSADGTNVPFSKTYGDGSALAMLSVSIPIFHWGEGSKKVRRAKIDLMNAELELHKNRRLMDIEVQQAVHNVQDGYHMISTAKVSLDQATENLRVMKTRYDASMSPLTDLLDAQSLWQQAESNLIEAQTQYKIYETEYLKAIGKLE